MEFLNQWLLPILLAWPILCSILVFISNDEKMIKWGSVIASLLPLGLSIYMLASYDYKSGAMAFVVDVPWITAINSNLHLGVDNLSIPLIFLTALLTTLSLYYSAFVIKLRVKEYFGLFHLLALSMYGVFMALDYVLFYVFWEISLVPMYLLIGIWGGKNRGYASIKFFIYTMVGSVGMLLAILGTFFATGTFDIMAAAAAQPFVNLPAPQALLLTSLAFWGFFFGFAFKVPSFPFHTWLPDAHTEAPTAGSVILAGVMLKLGGYGFIRIMLPTYPTAAAYWAEWVVALGAIAIVYGALVCIAQTDLKRLIAYSSVSHMGYVVLGIGAASVAFGKNAEGVTILTDPAKFQSAAMALNGATMQMFNHGLITGALFFLVGIIYERAHTRELSMFGGLSTKMPYYYGIMMVAAFASLGLPALSGFWGEIFTFRGAFDLATGWAAFAAIGIVLAAVYILYRIIMPVFLGSYDPHKIHHWSTGDGKDADGPTDMKGFEKVTLWPLIILIFALGVFPNPLLNFLNGAAVELLNRVQSVL
jgi:NADH-quinone oxidoreductase subunit M